MEATTAGRPAALARAIGDIGRALVEDLPFLSLITGFSIAVALAHYLLGFPPRLDLSASWQALGIMAVFYAVPAALALLVHSVVGRGKSLYDASTWTSVLRWLFRPRATAVFLVILLVLPVWIRSFVALKATIPDVQPFAWDVRFMEWDRILHFGQHPWVLLQPLLGTPLATRIIDVAYYLWFPVLWMTFIWQAWHGSRETLLRSRFLVSFALCWMILGVGMAMLFSSAGPVYYASVAQGMDPYAPLMDYLRSADEVYPLRALWIHDLLWTAYVQPETTAPQGIAAMPSLHVAITVLMIPLGFGIHRWLGWAYAVFAVFIFLGSIHLAWHYAIDGYAGGLGALGIWWLSGKLVRRWRDGPLRGGA